LSFIPLNINPDFLVPQLALIGVGVGLFRSPNHRALFGAVPRNKMGQAGGYQHLPRQLGESIGETGVVTLFTAIVLASAAAVGLHVATPAPLAASPATVPTVAPASSAAVPARVIQPYVPATQVGVPGPTTVDTDTADDTIVDVPDDSSSDSTDSGLPPAVTLLPAEVQMLGYRLMWALAGVIALGGAAISWFLRDDESEESEIAPDLRLPQSSSRGMKNSYRAGSA
jgi:hypothetical protein